MSDHGPFRDAGRTIQAWCLYDWANSAFTTLVVTFVYSTYFSQTFAADEDAGTALWSRGIVVSSLLVAVLSPLVGAMADRGAARRRYLMISTFVCVGATAALTFVTPGRPHSALLALSVFVTANVAFEVGMVFYNAFLPTIVTPERIGRVSGCGWGLGYAGGLVSLAVGLVGFVGLSGPGLLGLETTDHFHVRATNLLVAGWFLLFSIPTFLFVGDREPARPVNVRRALADLRVAFARVRRYREAVKFLVARLVYNDGLMTIFIFGGIYAAGTFGMSLTEVMIFGIAINVAAGLGAWAFGFIDDRVGGKTTVLVSLAALSVAALVAVLAPSRGWFWAAGLLIGIFAGPTQSASRSLMGRFAPTRHTSEFFGFYAFSGKATTFAGPLLLGLLTAGFGQRAGVAVVVVFFVVGGLLLLRVDEQRGIAAAREG